MNRVGRPRGSLKKRAELTVDPKVIARECWDLALGVIVDGRDVFERALEAFDNLQIGGPHEVLVPLMKLLSAALEVDMADPANRKGALARALEFRGARRDRVRNYAISLAFDQIRSSQVEGTKFVFSELETAEIVARAFEDIDIGIETGLTAEQVRQIVARSAD